MSGILSGCTDRMMDSLCGDFSVLHVSSSQDFEHSEEHSSCTEEGILMNSAFLRDDCEATCFNFADDPSN